ncbi:3-phosphoshikimate 1-carboxyvinyltransferase [Streptomyces griseoloalbus]|uniref:3-phosphoshikimate 1-carboxyvinyltransferase n=1 Tax=Streptomyces griseoloalbus TaxID=67303 RepID=UPI0018759191|nr:3-phosphoshikimate 1-carboxyvinyltransferase [Streptomyces griseoloalbus]
MTIAVPATPALHARIPGSKSLTNRALLLAAAADSTSALGAPLVSDDTTAFREALSGLGVRIDPSDDDSVWNVTGLGRGPVGTGTAWCADAGTAARFLPPFAATGHGDFGFEGSDQLTARPVAPLADALRRLGAEVTTGPGGRLPLRVRSRGLDGGALTVDSTLSSQFLTGLLMAGPLMRRPLALTVPELVSRPYIDMTIALMRRFGAEVDEATPGEFTVRPTGYRGADMPIEPDASTASYVFAAAAITGTSVRVPGLGRGSLQGDLRFTEVLARTGARVETTDEATTVTGTGAFRGGFTVDMGEISDTFMTLAAIAPLADAPITVNGIGHARLKESDRIAAVEGNLRALGIRTETGRDWITVHPGTPAPARVACHRDHRIAMAFSVLGLRAEGITLDDPGCVAKTFPGFHEELHRLFPRHSVPTAGSSRP